jgi:V8-like Glu-specific endopeptidase
MQLKLVSIVLSSLVASSISIASENQGPFLSKSNPNPQATSAYWTPDRMRDAEPLDLPQVDPDALKEISTEELQRRQHESTPIIHPGSPPSLSIPLDTQPLFKPVTRTVTKPLDAGTLKEQFSSQQLVPLSADQSYPYTTVGKLFFTTSTGNKTCSASVIGNRLITTAAHCINDGKGNSYRNWMFVPAYRDGTAPLRRWSWYGYMVPSDWSRGGGAVPSQWDWALMIVSNQQINHTDVSLGSLTGTLGFKTLSGIPNHSHLLGYSGNLDSGEKMHQVTAQSALAVEPNNVECGSDMSFGAGGGPWIQNFGPASTGQSGGTNPGRNLLIGITSYGYNNTKSLGNGSVILDSNFSAYYNALCRAFPDVC